MVFAYILVTLSPKTFTIRLQYGEVSDILLYDINLQSLMQNKGYKMIFHLRRLDVFFGTTIRATHLLNLTKEFMKTMDCIFVCAGQRS